MGEHLSNWDFTLPVAEFAYNSSVDKSTRLSPFEAITGCKPRKPIELLLFPLGDRPVHRPSLLPSMCMDLHTKVR